MNECPTQCQGLSSHSCFLKSYFNASCEPGFKAMDFWAVPEALYNSFKSEKILAG